MELLAGDSREMLLLIARYSLYVLDGTRLNGFGEPFDERINLNFPLKVNVELLNQAPVAHSTYIPPALARRRLTI